jgi:phosphohistidine swiveling domain-containing protein
MALENSKRETMQARQRATAPPVAVVRLGGPAVVTAQQGGGKAEALDQMARAGLPVPASWVVTADSYRAWLGWGLDESLRRLGSELDAAGDEGAPLSALVRAIAKEPACAVAAEQIQAALEQTVALASERFAARSSAVGEDGATHSFAGIYESFPGLRREEMGAGVVLCWASAFTPRAESYRQRVGASAADAPLAVVIQPLVPARAAGVAFTADPTTGSRRCILINATRGLGTTLVDGRVQPDQYRVPKGRAREKDVRVATGAKALREEVGPEGLVIVPTPEAERRQPALPARQALELARLLDRLERAAGAPRDAEWAWDGRQFWLLQSRPITRLPAPPGPILEWSRTNYRELYPELPAPLSSSYMEVLERDWGGDYFRRRGLNVSHVGPFLRIHQGRPFINYSMLKHVTLALGGEVESNLGNFGSADGAAPEWEMDVPRASPLRRAAIAWRYWRGRHTALRVLRHVARCVRAAEAIEPDDMGDFALVCRIEDAFLEMQPIDDAANDVGGALSLRRLLVEWLVGRHVDSFDLFLNDVIVSGPENASVAQALDLLRLAAMAREDEEARAFFLGSDEDLRSYWVALASIPFLEQLRAFLRRYGHRSLHESDSSVPRFREDPMPILRAIAAMVRAPQVEMPEQRLERQRAAASSAWRQAWRRLPAWEKLLPVRYLAARQTVRTLRLLMRYREGFRSEMARMIAERRRLETALGRRWQERGYLERAEDIYWLRLEELRRATEERPFKSILRSIVRDRKSEYERLAALDVPNLMVEVDGTLRPAREAAAEVEASPEDGLVLRGQPVSSGITEGVVRVIERPEDAAGMAPGTILVSPVVGPSWGPLYSIAGGLIVEMGGTLSHGAILAREYGLPTVTNIPGVTRALRTGDRVLLNANLGIVWRAPEREEGAGGVV